MPEIYGFPQVLLSQVGHRQESGIALFFRVGDRVLLLLRLYMACCSLVLIGSPPSDGGDEQLRIIKRWGRPCGRQS